MRQFMLSPSKRSSALPALRKIVVALALLVGAAQFAGSVPARAGLWSDGGSGGGDRPDYGADHDQVYQLQRGDKICRTREACGGAAAIPMNQPGWFYLPRGLYVSEPAPVVVPRHHHRRY